MNSNSVSSEDAGRTTGQRPIIKGPTNGAPQNGVPSLGPIRCRESRHEDSSLADVTEKFEREQVLAGFGSLHEVTTSSGCEEVNSVLKELRAVLNEADAAPAAIKNESYCSDYQKRQTKTTQYNLGTAPVVQPYCIDYTRREPALAGGTGGGSVASSVARERRSTTRQDLPFIPLEEKSVVLPRVQLTFLQKVGITIGAAAVVVALAVSGVECNNYSSKCVAEARLALEAGDFQSAIAASNKAIAFNPLSLEAQYEKGRALAFNKCYQEAEQYLSNVLRFNPEHIGALDARAALSLKVNKPQQTIDDSRKLMSLLGTELKPYQIGNLAAAQYTVGQYKDAMGTYEKAIEVEPTNVRLYVGRAYCLMAMSKFEGALALCQSLVSQFPDDGDAIALRGYCRQQLNDTAGAMRDFCLALEGEPTNPTYYKYRAGLYEQLGQSKEALADYKKAAGLDKFNLDTQILAASKLINAGLYSQASDNLKAASALPGFRKSFQAQFLRAQCSFAAGDYQESARDLEAALKQRQNDAARELLALNYAHLGKAGAARELLAHNLKSDSPSAQTLLAAARVEQVLGQELSAIDFYSRVLLRKPRQVEALVGRADCYLARKQYASAQADLSLAVEEGRGDKKTVDNLLLCQSVLKKQAHIVIDLPRSRTFNFKSLDATALFDKALKAYKQNDSDLCIAACYELTGREPNHSGAWRLLAHTLQECSRNQEAIDAFGSLTALESPTAADKLKMARALSAMQKHEQAIAILIEQHKLDRANGELTAELAKIYAASDRKDEAMKLCRQAIDGGKGSEQALVQIKNLYQSLLAEKERARGANDGSSVLQDTQG
ncbi:MAG: tetratricopeptide repeat protein [Candidatus Obscuribacter sp.]|nr:tetratricopeptide repeat protein [Candidatus Obscuribacter sp.]